MQIMDIGEVIAERVLEIGGAAGPASLTVKLGMPVPDPTAPECWYCPYSISSPGDERIRYAAGIDSVQALRLALVMIAADLDNLYGKHGLTWKGSGELGFSGSP